MSSSSWSTTSAKSTSATLLLLLAVFGVSTVLVDGRMNFHHNHRPFGVTTIESSSLGNERQRQRWQPIERILNHLRCGGSGEDVDATYTTATTITDTSSSSSEETLEEQQQEENTKSLDEKVYEAMRKLGMQPPPFENVDDNNDNPECEGGVCPIPTNKDNGNATKKTATASTTASSPHQQQQSFRDSEDPVQLATQISEELNVPLNLALLAVGATATMDENSSSDDNETIRVLDYEAAKQFLVEELEFVNESIPIDSPNVQKLLEEDERLDVVSIRRALAYVDNDIDDARVILQKDLQKENDNNQQVESIDTDDGRLNVTIDVLNIKGGAESVDAPTMDSSSTTTTSTAEDTSSQSSMIPPAAKKEAVVFEATTSDIQKLVLESKVPVLLDIYADWCGPCKVLGPALEEMAVKGGGMFRLVKVNSDNERPVSEALEVTALPTVFGVRDGKIVHMFQGMPKSEDMMKNFMMGLFGAAPFAPPVTGAELLKYEELTKKLMKTAGAASFSFSARERLIDRVTSKLDDMVKDENIPDVEVAATLIRTLLNNIINHPFDTKYRNVKLDNKVVVAKLGDNNPSSIAVLKSIGFAKQAPVGVVGLGTEMVYRSDKKSINLAPLVVARDCIDKWIQRNRVEMAAAARKRKDEMDRAKLIAEREAAGVDINNTNDDNNEEEEEVKDPTICTLKLRLDGKKKVHEVQLHQDDHLSKVLEMMDINVDAGENVQITCVAKRLVVKSADTAAMQKTLSDHGLMPASALVIKVSSSEKERPVSSSSSLKERASKGRKRKSGSNTMQSTGIYAKDDNLKGELIDGGAGALYEQDVTDDEAEEDDKAEEGDEEKDDSDDK